MGASYILSVNKYQGYLVAVTEKEERQNKVTAFISSIETHYGGSYKQI